MKSGVNDALVSVMDAVARFLLAVGGVAAVLGIGILLYHVFGTGSADPTAVQNALKLQEIFKAAGLIGMLGAALGAAWLFWGEETAGPVMLIAGFALVLCTWYVPMMGVQVSNELQRSAMTSLSNCGYPALGVGFILVISDVIAKVRQRAAQGARAEQLKYGKGMKEEKDIRNVFLGKCWQLPYCRKFVRERCPIYHAKRTCWKERVGCMCEESVIKSAMEGKTITKESIASANFIPKNRTLPPAAKAERCRQCVIYNEHQKHKYQLLLPLVAMGVASLYIAFRSQAAEGIRTGLLQVDEGYRTVIPTGSGAVSDAAQRTGVTGGIIPYHEIILIVLTLVVLAYSIKVLEFLIWKLKV